MRQSLKSSSKKQIAEQRAGQARAEAASTARQSITRYAITKPCPHTTPAESPCRVICAGVFDTRKEAESWLAAALANRSQERTMRQVYGDDALSPGWLAVEPVECWANGNPKGIYVEVLDGHATAPAQPPTEREQVLFGKGTDLTHSWL
jgi:hypothetical protein